MRIFIFAGLIAAVCASGALAQGEAGRFDLVCVGAGSANRVASATVNAWDSYGGYGSANIVGNRVVPFDDQVNLWVENGDGRIRMPRAMLPVVRGGENGWFKLKSIEITDNEITASVAVNVINSPKLRIDRLTGSISISGKAGDYSGRCTKYDPANVERRF